MSPITSVSSLSGGLLIAVIAVLLFIEETGIPLPFAPGDVLLMIAGIAIASGAVEPVPMVGAILLATSVGALVGREVFAHVGRPALMRAANALRFRPALERAIHLLRRGGARAVFIGRLIPGLRIHTTQAAGVSNMPRLTFAAGLVPSVLVYAAVFVGLGALVGQPAVRLFNRAEHRFFAIAVTVFAALALVLSVRWLARRGSLSALEPIVVGVRRDLADSIEVLFMRPGEEARTRQYPLVRRLWAGLIDTSIVVVIAVLIVTAVSGPDRTEIIFGPQGLLLLGVIALAYRVPFEARTGQTIGKALMGLGIYGPNGRAPGWWRAGLRNLLGLLPPFWMVDAVLLLRTARRQRLGDLVTRTTLRRVAQ